MMCVCVCVYVLVPEPTARTADGTNACAKNGSVMVLESSFASFDPAHTHTHTYY